MKNNLEPIEEQIIRSIVAENVKTIGVVKIADIVNVWRKPYLALTTVITLAGIVLSGWPILVFFLPLIPLVFLGLLEFIDMAIIARSAAKIHTLAIRRKITVEYEDMMRYVMEYIYDTEEDVDNSANV